MSTIPIFTFFIVLLLLPLPLPLPVGDSRIVVRRDDKGEHAYPDTAEADLEGSKADDETRAKLIEHHKAQVAAEAEAKAKAKAEADAAAEAEKDNKDSTAPAEEEKKPEDTAEAKTEDASKPAEDDAAAAATTDEAQPADATTEEKKAYDEEKKAESADAVKPDDAENKAADDDAAAATDPAALWTTSWVIWKIISIQQLASWISRIVRCCRGCAANLEQNGGPWCGTNIVDKRNTWTNDIRLWLSCIGDVLTVIGFGFL